jgi:alpha-tubulin suppressor-like RCC1 family protein
LISENLEYVSLGAFHSLAINQKGSVFAWGQNKYGKLGVEGSVASEGDVLYRPSKIFLNRLTNNMKDIERDDFDKVVGVCCGTNHSVALT